MGFERLEILYVTSSLLVSVTQIVLLSTDGMHTKCKNGEIEYNRAQT